MIEYAPAKINIGLKILNKREDGFHNLHSYFYPVPLFDLLEIQQYKKDLLIQTGLISTTTAKDNLVYKALVLLRHYFDIPPLKIHLHKQIPFQAGLGGGSGNAISFIKLVSKVFKFTLSPSQWLVLANALGSDCPFFIHAVPSEVKGKGEIVKPIAWSLKGIKIIIIKPNISVKTSEAFQNINTDKDILKDICTVSLKEYQNTFENQFEENLVPKYPFITEIKNKLLQSGAFYVSLSGSGSAVFGLFHKMVKINFSSSYFVWKGELQ